MDTLVTLLEREGLLMPDGETPVASEGITRTNGAAPRLVGVGIELFSRSLVRRGMILYGMARRTEPESTRPFLVLAAPRRPHTRETEGFSLQVVHPDRPWVATAEPSVYHAWALNVRFPWTRPRSVRGYPSLTVVDPLGLTFPACLRIARTWGVVPALVRSHPTELTAVSRSFERAAADATWAVFLEGFRRPFAVVGDGITDAAVIDDVLAASASTIVLNLTPWVRWEVLQWEAAAVRREFDHLDPSHQRRVINRYAGQRFPLGSGRHREELTVTPLQARRYALMFLPAMQFCRRVWEHLQRSQGGDADLEVSLVHAEAPPGSGVLADAGTHADANATERARAESASSTFIHTPTEPAYHLFLSRELQYDGIALSAFEPTLPAEPDAIRRALALHMYVADDQGGYKVSVRATPELHSAFAMHGRSLGAGKAGGASSARFRA